MKIIRNKYLIEIPVFLSLLMPCLLFQSCTENRVMPEKELPDSLNYELAADFTGSDLTIRFVDSSYTKAILKAKRGRVFNERYETLLDGGLEVEFLSRYSGKRISLLTADSARIDDKTKNMFARSNVVVFADSTRRKLETQLLMWDNASQKLYSTEYVRISSPDEDLQGWGFESDLYLSNYRIFKVSGVRK